MTALRAVGGPAATALVAAALFAPVRATAQSDVIVAQPAAPLSGAPSLAEPRPPSPANSYAASPPSSLYRSPEEHGPRLLFSLGYVVAAGWQSQILAASVLGIDASVGVQIDPVISVQLQGTFGTSFESDLARGALVVAFAPIRDLSVGFGGSVTYPSQLPMRDRGMAVGVPLDLTFCIGPRARRGERRHGLMIGLRLDPGVAVRPTLGPAFYSHFVIGYITR